MSGHREPRPTRAVLLSLLLTFSSVCAAPNAPSGSDALTAGNSSTTSGEYAARQAHPRWLPHRESSQSQLQGPTGGPALPLPRTNIPARPSSAPTSNAPSYQGPPGGQSTQPSSSHISPALSAHLESSVTPSDSPSHPHGTRISYAPQIESSQRSLDLPGQTHNPPQQGPPRTPTPYGPAVPPPPHSATQYAPPVAVTKTPESSLDGPTGAVPGISYGPGAPGGASDPPAGSGGEDAGSPGSPPSYVTEPLTLTSGTAVITTWTVVVAPPGGPSPTTLAIQPVTAHIESSTWSVAVATGPIVVLPPSSLGPAPVYGGGGGGNGSSGPSVAPASVSGAGSSEGSSGPSGGRPGFAPGADGQTNPSAGGESSPADSAGSASATSPATASSNVAAAAPDPEPTLQDAGAAVGFGRDVVSLLSLPLLAMGMLA